MSHEFEKIIYCLPQGHQIEVPDFIKQDEKISFHQGIPDFQEFEEETHKLIILDDLMSEIDSNVMNLFTRYSHHKKISVIFLVQNLFYGANKFFRTIAYNCHYLISMKNPRNRRQISSLASQLHYSNKFIEESFRDATKLPYQYLLFDFSQKCNDQVRIRTNIFPDDIPQNIIYVPR